MTAMEGREIRQLRRRAGLTQEALAERLGVDQGTVSRWERGVERPRPRRLSLVRQLLLVDAEQIARHRQLAMIRSDMVAGGLHDDRLRMREISGKVARYYRNRHNYDITRDYGKSLEQQFLERDGAEAWKAIQLSGLLEGTALMVRLFFSTATFSHLTHYEPIFEDGAMSGTVAYIARSVPTGTELPPPRLRYADALMIDNPGEVVTLYSGVGAKTARHLLSEDALI